MADVFDLLSANVVRAGSANFGVVYVTLAAGGIAGVALAYLARRRRWPQVLLAGLGVPATYFGAWAVVDMYRTPPGSLWPFFFRVVLILLAGGIGLLLAGLGRPDAAPLGRPLICGWGTAAVRKEF